ncbi:MAG: hypothetical protein MAG794_00193 [Gammaproteobacteria bacterium]|nr:hypothetical protein [Gammaproteobacteria bacterium]
MKCRFGNLFAVSLFVCGAAHAQFVVDQVDAIQSDEDIRVQVDLDLNLTDATERALSHGVPLIVVHEIALNQRGWLWSRIEQRTSVRYRLRYHVLSGRYLVDSNEAVLNTFRSVSDALEFIDSTSVTFDVSARHADHSVAVRSRIDINALPAPLRPTALFSPQWQLSSDWSQWPINELSTN